MCLNKKYLLWVLSVWLFSGSAFSAMTITGTRIIFPGSENEVSVRTNNKGTTPPLVQVWVDDGRTSADINNMKIPFLVTPPVYRVEPGKGQMVRLLYNGMALPQDRESVYWFNMLEIPPVDKTVASPANKLELAFRTRIKIFYRPESLQSSSAAETDKLQWSVIDDTKKGRGIRVVNQTPYYMSFEGATVKAAGKVYSVDLNMVSPFSTSDAFATPALTSSAAIQTIVYRIINDYGAVSSHTLAQNGQKVWKETTVDNKQ